MNFVNYQRKVLPNGLRVLTISMPSLESVTAMIMVGAGSRYESKKNTGVSHFLEHMAFKGTLRRPSAMEISSIIDGMGGEFNASTGKEVTAFYIKSSVDKADLSLDILSDMLINSKLDSAEIEKEKGVIIEEINMIEDTPMRNLGDIYERLIYGDTPLGWDIAGEKGVIRRVKREDFVNYMQNLYSPHNMTVVFAGGIDGKKSVELAEKYLGKMKRFDTSLYIKYQEKQNKPKLFIKNKKTEQAHIAIGFKTVKNDHPDKYPLEVLATLLGGGMSSRLFHEVREKRGLGYYIATSSDGYMDAGSLVSACGVDPKRAEEAIKVILEEHGKIKSEALKIKSKELKKAKEYIKGHLVLGLENSRSVAYSYACQELLEKEIKNPDQIIRKVDNVTVEQVENVTKRYFVEEGLNIAIIGNFENRQSFENLLTFK